jgi:hypothetical protein
MLVGAETSVFRRSECHGSLRQINISALAGWNVAPQIPATGQQDEIHEPGRDHDSQPIAPATSESDAGAVQERIDRTCRFASLAKTARDQFSRIFFISMARTVNHYDLHGFLRMQAIHSAKEISSTSGRRRSTLLRRSLQPDGGPRSSPRRSSPERLFLEYLIRCPACCPNGRDANSLPHRSLFQFSAHSRDEAVKDFTVHKKCCHSDEDAPITIKLSDATPEKQKPGHRDRAKCLIFCGGNRSLEKCLKSKTYIEKQSNKT